MVPFGIDPGDPSQQVYFPSNGTEVITNATLDIESDTPATGNNDPTGYSNVLVNGNISLDPFQEGTLQITFDSGFTPEAGDSFALFVSTNNDITGDFSTDEFPNLPSGLTWNWQPSIGTLSIMGAVPEPAAYALIFGAGMLGLMVLRRRRRK